MDHITRICQLHRLLSGYRQSAPMRTNMDPLECPRATASLNIQDMWDTLAAIYPGLLENLMVKTTAPFDFVMHSRK